MTRLEEIKERLSKATEGEWESGNYGDVGVVGTDWGVGYPKRRGTIASLNDGEYIENENSKNDSDFIANSKSDITYLLDRVEKLEGGLLGIINAEDSKDQRQMIELAKQDLENTQ